MSGSLKRLIPMRAPQSSVGISSWRAEEGGGWGSLRGNRLLLVNKHKTFKNHYTNQGLQTFNTNDTCFYPALLLCLSMTV